LGRVAVLFGELPRRPGRLLLQPAHRGQRRGRTLGDFKSKVSAIGPQAGWFFSVGGKKWYANVKGYYEFNAQNRPEGWNVWLAVAIPFTEEKK
jgi:hypothetical protein